MVQDVERQSALERVPAVPSDELCDRGVPEEAAGVMAVTGGGGAVGDGGGCAAVVPEQWTGQAYVKRREGVGVRLLAARWYAHALMWPLAFRGDDVTTISGWGITRSYPDMCS